MIWAEELAQLRVIGEESGVDVYLLAAIRRAENGGPGREFGVLSVEAPSWEDQARVCAATVRGVLVRSHAKAFRRVERVGARARLAYSPAVIGDLGRRYAPVSADNDPRGLNLAWVSNVGKLYERFCQHGAA